ncbi:unnamed protein product [marine sediment metagenome]|uniref:Uncharacterized protein n=1 Tax=marine sediment metagenome TaxID=412755 RepID=X0WTM5_9ZZZZ
MMSRDCFVCGKEIKNRKGTRRTTCKTKRCQRLLGMYHQYRWHAKRRYNTPEEFEHKRLRLKMMQKGLDDARIEMFGGKDDL